MKFIVEYEDSVTSFLNINNIILEYEDIIIESKVGDWIIQAPKVRKMQEKANAERIEAVRMESQQKQQMDAAEAAGQKIDKARMWKLLQDKLDAREDMAKEYEDEAIILAGTNQYLMKVRRITRLKGVIRANNEKIRISTAEERRELNKKNKEYEAIIKQESQEVQDKIKEDKAKLAEAKKKANISDKKDKEDVYNTYFQHKKADQLRK